MKVELDSAMAFRVLDLIRWRVSPIVQERNQDLYEEVSEQLRKLGFNTGKIVEKNKGLDEVFSDAIQPKTLLEIYTNLKEGE